MFKKYSNTQERMLPDYSQQSWAFRAIPSKNGDGLRMVGILQPLRDSKTPN
jgi:hypothetical protein